MTEATDVSPAPEEAPLLSATEAAARLGVKRETLYAYVSRGLLRSRAAPQGRGRLFDPAEVDRLRARPGGRRPTRAADALEIASSVTTMTGGRLRYRGHALEEVAGAWPFESVAQLLWTGSLTTPTSPWRAPAAVEASVAALRAVLPLASGPGARLQAAVVGARAADPLRDDLRPDAVAGTGRALLAALAGVAGPEVAPPDRSVAARATASLGLDERWTGVVDVILVSLADHELATSTLAGRVAASTRADPYAVVLAGLAAVSGPLHGSASGQVHRLLSDVADGAAPERAVASRWRDHGHMAGFGHGLYPQGDPRTAVVLDALRAAAADHPAWATVEAVAAAASSRAPQAPNIDWALAAFALVAGVPADSGEALFSLARVAGWLAHAIEEYDAPPLRYRVTAI